ncbi:putative late blight resistance protein R1A-10 [Capsicum annuum]
MAHASVASLSRTIESLLTFNSPMQSLICDHREEFCALHEKVSSLEVFLKNFEKNNVAGEMTDFEVEVKEVASAVEYTIQLRLTETVLGENESQKKKARRRFRHSLQQVAEDMDHIWKESTKIQDKGKQVSKESLVHDFSSSTNDILNVNNNMVGRDDQKEHLLEDLTGIYSGKPKVIPIVGMGGIGKTTLAKEVYNHESVLRHFDVRAWATVSQQHNIKEIFLSLLQSMIKMDDTVKTKDEAELADMLQKSLKRKRYLIFLDDIWSCEVWDGMRRCFPTEDNAGSRILLTTRNNEVACYADTENLSVRISFMDQNESWSLFKSAAFSSEALPYEFETVGKQIADECHGLPLTIVVVAGLLKSKRAIEDWKSVAKDVKSLVTIDPDERCSRVLGLSYSHLTRDLKTCLLHFGIFPEDSEIPVNNLMRSWMAEGFLKLENDLDGEAEKCLQELVDRCLVLVCKKSLDGIKIRSCKVHDLIYDLMWKSQYAKMRPFKCVTGDEIDYCPYGLYRALLTPVHRQLRDHDNNDLLKQTYSIFSFALSDSKYFLKSELIHFKLLKVLELRHREIYNFPLQILSLIWLRYLSLQCDENLNIPPEICRLWNLQTFIVQGCGRSVLITFPEEIWGLLQLRHLKLPKFYLPSPPSGSVDKGRHLEFTNLQIISYLSPHCCTKEVIMGIQNVKKLGIRVYETDSNSIRDSGLLNNLVHLHQLETLSFISYFPHFLASSKAFPATLKKMKLERTWLSWSDLDIIAELPNLEVLKLMHGACYGDEWYPNVRGFSRLKVLSIEHSFLIYWKATDDNFRTLERLMLSNLYCLKEIPIKFAEIHTLQLIELIDCFSELVESAARIQQEQEELGNNIVDVRISDPLLEGLNSCKYRGFFEQLLEKRRQGEDEQQKHSIVFLFNNGSLIR